MDVLGAIVLGGVFLLLLGVAFWLHSNLRNNAVVPI